MQISNANMQINLNTSASQHATTKHAKYYLPVIVTKSRD